MSEYPTPIREDSGCKVGWLTYDNQADAEKASQIAVEWGRKRAARGYDFGYESPGQVVHKVNSDTGEERWIVTIP
jgi:hypothetical protein